MAYTYRIINNSYIKDPQEISLVNNCFQIWKKYFEEDLSSRGEKLNLNEFHRARYIAVILSDDDVAGFHLYSIFDYREEQSKSHSYMSVLHPVIGQVLKKDQNTMMTMEYLTVAEKFRRKAPGANYAEAGNIAEMVVRLGLKFARELGVDVAAGVARQDRKVNVLGSRVGFTDVETVVKYENSCSIMSFDLRNSENQDDNLMIARVEDLWRTRQQFNKFNKVA